MGKSTLLLDVASRVAAGRRQVLYVTGEESTGQIRLRAERIGALSLHLLLAAVIPEGSGEPGELPADLELLTARDLGQALRLTRERRCPQV